MPFMIHSYATIKSEVVIEGGRNDQIYDLLGEIQSFLENQRKDVLLAKKR